MHLGEIGMKEEKVQGFSYQMQWISGPGGGAGSDLLNASFIH